MKYSEVEYSSLRAELIHHDGSCLTILGLLLASSTAIYGLVADKGLFPLLIMLSMIWLVGFLYIVEKRSTIRRISRYIKTRIEKESDILNWETYSRQDRYVEDDAKNDIDSSPLGAKYRSGLAPGFVPLIEEIVISKAPINF